MRLALDTNAYSALQLGNAPKLKGLADQAELLALPFIVSAELQAGFLKGQRASENYNKLQMFQNLDRVTILWPNEQTTELYAQVWLELAAKGKPIPTSDVWIATLCLQHQLGLATADAHFSNVPLLHIFSY